MTKRGKRGKHKRPTFVKPDRCGGQRGKPAAVAALPPLSEQWQIAIIAAFAIVCLAALAAAHVDLTGHDYGFFLPKMLDAHYFYLKNGLFALQEYSAALCAGVFKFASPQSMALALPQVLSYFFGPRFGIAATFVVSSALAGGGIYLCARFWGLGRMPAAVAAVAYAFNGFLLTRLAIGHLAFYGFGFAPILAAVLLYGIDAMRGGKALSAAAYGCLAALILAVLIYGGTGPVLIFILGIVALILLICGGFDRAWLKAALYCLLWGGLGLLAAAPKIEAATAMNANLTRDFYPLPGFDLIGLFSAWFQGLFWIPATEVLNARFLNKQFILGWQEIYYGFTPIIPVLLAAGLFLGRGRLPFRAVWRRRAVFGVVAAALMAAVAVNFYQPHWNSFLKSLPIIGQFSGMTRFFALFIPAVALLAGWVAQARRIPVGAVLALTVALAYTQYNVLQSNLRPGMYYDRVGLNPVLAAWNLPAGQIPPTREVMIKTERPANGVLRVVPTSFDDHRLIEGKSNAGCYESLFGYRLERYQPKSLRNGDIGAVDGQGNLNMKNPACYVYPRANHCAPGDHFTAAQRESMLILANRGDPGLGLSRRRQTANVIGAATLSLLAGFLVLLTARTAWRASRRRGASPMTTPIKRNHNA